MLRQLALHAQHSKRRSLEGAVAFAAFVPRSAQRPVITALTAYQVIFDYLDTLSEQPNVDPVKNGHQLHQALLSALEPGCAGCDYYAHCRLRGDGGYLDALVESCRSALARLPSHRAILTPVRRAAERIVTYQSLNHGDAARSHDAFTRWAAGETKPNTGLRWWETGAAAGSSLGVLALISATADPTLTARETDALDDAYYPWIGALHTLLDSLVDHREDTSAPGQRSLIDYYASPAETASRLEMIAIQAVHRAALLPNACNHAMLLAAMTCFYLSEPQASAPAARLARRQVLAAMGGLAAPTMAVFRARRGADRLLAGARLETAQPPARARVRTQRVDFPLVESAAHRNDGCA